MRICASCGEESPDRARFCIVCGSELGDEPEQRFRKVITLLFCDIVDAASLHERLDPPTLSQVLGEYYDAMRPLIEKHGGTVAKFIGDAIMSVFGVPVLHEDDALRACRAALEMQERLDELNAELEAHWGLRLATRMGINTGEVSGIGVARAQNFVAGDAANTAARFQQNAGPGQILMGDATLRLVRDGVRVEEVEPLTMKGKDEQVRAYNLVAVRLDAEALRRRHEAPLVGREAELELLERRFGRVSEQRCCEMVALLADAGVGKSRLVEELARRIEADALVLRGRCLSYGEGITFWPLLEVVRQLAEIDEEDVRTVARAKLAALVGPKEDDVVERVASAIGLSDEQFAVQEIFWGTRKLLESVAAERPLAVVFDDVHWAEPTLLDLIEHLLNTVSDVPLLLICPARYDLLERRPQWGEGEKVTVLRLKPLSDTDVGHVIANMLGDVEIPADARARIAAAAEGNPLYVEQMLSMLLDEGLLRRTDGRFEATTDLARISVPPTVSALVAARIDNLPRDERAVVEPAAVIGLVFPQSAVEELVGEPVRPAVVEHLVALSAKQLVLPESETPTADDEYRFGHLLIRDAAYEGLLKQARASLHERVAEWSERVYREHGREAELEEILGYHLEQAYRYRAELGPVGRHGRELGVRAAERLAAAGRRAFQRGDMQAAANLLGRAATLFGDGDARRLELLPDLAEALTSTGEFPRALALLDETVATADQLDDAPLRAEASLVRLFVQGYATESGWSERIIPEVRAAMAVLEQAESHAALAKGWRLLGSIYGTACRYGEAAAAVQQAIAHARAAGDRRQELQNTSAYAQALVFGPTPVCKAIPECERVLELAGGNHGPRAFVLAVLAQLQAMRGRPEEARVCYVSARALFEDLGITILAAWVSLQSAPAELIAGNLAAAERELQYAYDVLERIGEKYYLSTVNALLGQVRYAQGRYDDALQVSDAARAIATEDDVETQALWRSVRAKVLAQAGAEDEALTLAQEAVALSRRTDSPVIQADALVDLAKVLRLTRRDPDPALREAVLLYERKENVAAARSAGELLASPAV